MGANGRSADEILLQVRNLKKHFPIRSGLLRRQTGAVQAVDGISFDLYRGETLALVGGPHSGKTTAARAILQLTKPTAGRVIFDNKDVTKLRGGKLRQMRQHMQLVMQDPYTSLDPRMNISDIIGEPLEVHKIDNGASRNKRVAELLQQVAMNPYLARRFPYECSGGQRQRISMARALATNPDLVIMDEPVAALDPAVQQQIIDLLLELKQTQGVTYLYLARNLRLVRQISDRIAILYLGRIVELADTASLYETPLHPYTQYLLSTIPLADAAAEAQRQEMALTGSEPDAANPPRACRFHPRCPYATEVCREEDPEWRNLGTAKRPHWVACHHAERFHH